MSRDICPYQKEIKNLRSNLTTAEMKKTLQALEEAGVADKRDSYLACIIKSNLDVFREVINMIPELKERFLEMAEQDGWLDEWGKKRVNQELKEVARGFKRKNYPLTDISEITGLPLHEVEAL